MVILSQTVSIPQATRAKLEVPNIPSQAECVSLETEPCRDVQLERFVLSGHDLRTATDGPPPWVKVGVGSSNKGLMLHYSIFLGGCGRVFENSLILDMCIYEN